MHVVAKCNECIPLHTVKQNYIITIDNKEKTSLNKYSYYINDQSAVVVLNRALAILDDCVDLARVSAFDQLLKLHLCVHKDEPRATIVENQMACESRVGRVDAASDTTSEYCTDERHEPSRRVATQYSHTLSTFHSELFLFLVVHKNRQHTKYEIKNDILITIRFYLL